MVTATAADVRKGKTIVDRDGDPIGGTMPDIAGRTITPTTSQQVLNGGGYLAGNVVVPGFTMPPANVIKKGYSLNLFGMKVTGSFEGWVPTPQDLYYNGQNPAGFTLDARYLKFENTRISITGTPSSELNIGSAIKFTKTYDVRSYSKLIFEGYFAYMGNADYWYRTLYLSCAGVSYSLENGTVKSITLDITQVTSIPSGSAVSIRIGSGGYFTRIRLA